MAKTPGFLTFLDKQIRMNSAEDAEEIAQTIESFSNLKTLELMGNTVGVEAGKRLARALELHPELERCLWSDIFTGRLKTEIPIILRSMCDAIINAKCRITELDLSDNAFGPVGAEGLSKFLVSPSAYSLEVLKLNNNGLGAGGKTIAECLHQCQWNALRDRDAFELKTFIAGRNRLEDPGAKALAETFMALQSLEEIRLPQNGIRPSGIIALARSFRFNSYLRIIDLNDNTCTSKGAKALAKVLDELTDLEVLDLGDCLCRNEGIKSICEAIFDKKHNKIKYLDFSGNGLSAETAKEIIKNWKILYASNKDVLLRMSNNCYGSKFDKLKKMAERSRIELGEFDDDEGSSSDDYSDKEDRDLDSDDMIDDEALENPPKIGFAAGDDKDLEELQEGVGCMKVKDQKSVSSVPGDDIVSFLDQQLKLNTAQDAEPVAQRIEQQHLMRVLELRGNTLGIESGKRIAEAIKCHPELERCLWSDMFTGRLKNEIPPILKSLCSAMIVANCHITELDLSDNAFGPIGAEGIQQFLVSPAAFSLEVLKLNNNGLGAGGKVIAKCLSDCYDNSVKTGRPLKLKTFIAGRNRLEVPGATALASAFAKIKTLEEIAIPQNGITAMGVGALASCFKENPSLRVINLNDNTATQLGSEMIARAVVSLPKLEVLNLGDCLCRDQGCHAIVDALSPAVHRNLKELDISGAELTGEAAKQIIGKWRKFASMKTRLNLTSNNFGRLFNQIKKSVGGNILVGEEDDDQGSLSSNDEEKMSGDDSEDDEDEEEEEEKVDGTPDKEDVDPAQLLQDCKNDIEAARTQFESATQEESARLILRLADVIAKSFKKPEVIDDVFYEALDAAQDVLVRVKQVHRRPIPATTQLVNNLVAQAGFVKCEEKWDIPVDHDALAMLLHNLVSRSILHNQRDTIRKYFGQP